ncbi:hypothetical protein [Mycoplana dimorpha]|uniref:hypothetical protein n=1 Tax=Mycoplana dimorpha TaxID=28320 RepID=UPI0011B289FF|nr:hypothetical protein [Mycoplana dimorpha]
MQDHLGALNDLMSGPNVLAELGSDEEAAKGILPQKKKGDLIRMAQNALDDVIDAKRYWR